MPKSSSVKDPALGLPFPSLHRSCLGPIPWTSYPLIPKKEERPSLVICMLSSVTALRAHLTILMSMILFWKSSGQFHSSSIDLLQGSVCKVYHRIPRQNVNNPIRSSNRRIVLYFSRWLIAIVCLGRCDPHREKRTSTCKSRFFKCLHQTRTFAVFRCQQKRLH